MLSFNAWLQAAVLLTSLAFCGLYGALIVPLMMQSGMDGFKAMTSLAGVVKMFQSPTLVLAGWIHYVVGDLWVGRWIAIDARKRRMPYLLVAPLLALTLLLAPVGLGAYLLVRGVFKEAKGTARNKVE
ncbi:hypothetical protein QJQ45_012728 [Haematococcus lacustris]|nr:hypothetical protein QJQ45_012728 [Haematococcus lacustris]